MMRVWDLPVRVFHWTLVAAFTFALLTGDAWRSPHEIAGYIVAGLVALRILWGFIGSRHARFSNFLYRPRTIRAFLIKTACLRAERHLGHNPAGGAMIIALLISIAIVATTGYMMTTDAFWGIGWVQATHASAAYVTLALVGLHVAGVILASLEHRENLTLAMITGNKRRD